MTVTEYVPFTKAGLKVQDPVDTEAVKVHVTGEPEAGVAVTVIRAPELNPARSNVGVVSTVLLSVADDPLSEAL